MWILFAVLSAALLALVIRQRAQYRKLQREIGYISSRLGALSIASENGFVLLPTDHACIKRLGSAVNTLLQDFYEKRAEFEQAQKAMAQVLTNISHDIRTPLTVLKGNSEMLAAGAEGLPEEVRGMAARIDRKADDLIATINDYFTMSKIASGDFPLQLKKENIAGLCRDTILDYYDLLENRQFAVEIQLPQAPVYADTDRDALQRILKNLIDNAIRHGGDGRYIALRLTAGKGACVIEVEDHGKGMSPQQQKQIFTRNYTTAPRTLGNGLGLAIAKKLAEQIGAELQVRSVQDAGTVFTVVLKKLENR